MTAPRVPALRVLEKYRDKLDAKARHEGHADINELKKAYSEKIQDQRLKDAATTTFPTVSPVETSDETAVQSKSSSSTPGPLSPAAVSAHNPSSPNSVKPLDAILDLPKARDLPVPELSAIWRLRHASSPNSLCAVVPAHTYAAMEEAARKNPQFVLPVPHPEQGAEIHFLQWTFDPPTSTSTVLFTQLAEYKARGEFAVPHTTITHHLDLQGDKGIVLMQGNVMEGRGVKADDARWLVMCLQRFYGGWDGEKSEVSKERALERRKLVEWFATGDERFSVEKLMEEAERMG
ncbi:putative f1f0 atp synthase assembly protein atp11 protein [Phaeoacremonium minimum UCRPA7]|uniref:Putative f1f0 atp synthase assembly protein atp11 protein n=1 Tax=Phaeoacremonium minimum (strain UCR-PA7) TaxID=1286976 RepID=R8BBV9_PHAM7|nr:putative f1f0 atp synthase assembly protein atp11 protein [Phaeoacremonium minimum UCRPA7]EON96785.1 putative f1f0 atp synthase assembly protein atp11 protein [Phaeoacremonium minimum UCRPA7]